MNENLNNNQNLNTSNNVQQPVVNTPNTGVVPQPQPVIQNVNNQVPVSNNKNNKKGISKYVIIAGLVILFVGILYMFFFTDIIHSSNEKNDPEETTQEYKIARKFEGKYQKDGIQINIYALWSGKVYYIITGDSGIFEGIATVNDNIAENEDEFDSSVIYKFVLRNGNIELTIKNNNTYIGEGLYEKVDDYTAEEFYKDKIGDPSFINSNYSGLYKKDNIELLMYQTSENEIEVSITKNAGVDSKYWGRTFIIEGDGFIEERRTTSEDIISSLTMKDNKVEFHYSGESDTFEEFDGTYTKERDLTLNYLINRAYSN